MRAPESELLIRLFRAALGAADPANCLPGFLPTARPAGRSFVIGAGKAAASMAAATTAWYRAHDLGPLCGAVVTRYGHGLRPGEEAPGIQILEAGHPVPDEASVAAGARMLELARECSPDDRCIVLLSGGASALMVQPIPGITLADKQALTRQLLDSGAAIAEINAVRRKLSAIKGGGLARQLRAREILLYAISDVPGDVAGDIGSGPLSPDPVSGREARAILDRYGIEPPPAVARAFDGPPPGEVGQAEVPQVTMRLIATSSTAVAAAARAAELEGWQPVLLPEVSGRSRDAARDHAAIIRDLRARRQRVALISGGETTAGVTHPGARGGRNGEYLLALALELGTESGVYALAADTDGIDGTGDNAGALVTPDSLARAAGAGQDAALSLAEQCSYEFFSGLGDLVITGPTRTNVNDLRIALVA